LFPGCHSLSIRQVAPNPGTSSDINQYSIIAVHSAEGDELKLSQPIEMKGDIEVSLLPKN